MSTITGMTAAAMQAIRDGMVVGASYDALGHLMLTRYDGTTFDAGIIANGTELQPGVLELATAAETITGTDVSRAVTAASVAAAYGGRISALEATTIQVITNVNESTPSDGYLQGISLQVLFTGSGWSLNGGLGAVVTTKMHLNRTAQTFYANAGGTNAVRVWTRHYNSTDGGGGWTAWVEMKTQTTLTPASFTQATLYTSYPVGESRLYYSTTTGGSWDFSGLAGEVVTTKDIVAGAALQVFRELAGGSANPSFWYRTATSSGWTSWQSVLVGGAAAWNTYTPVWTATGTNPSKGNGTLTGRWYKVGTKATVNVNLIVGNTTTLGAGDYSFTIPRLSSASGGIAIGHAQLLDNKRWLGQVVVAAGVSTMSPFFPIRVDTVESNFQREDRPEAMDVGASLRMTVSYECVP